MEFLHDDPRRNVEAERGFRKLRFETPNNGPAADFPARDEFGTSESGAPLPRSRRLS